MSVGKVAVAVVGRAVAALISLVREVSIQNIHDHRCSSPAEELRQQEVKAKASNKEVGLYHQIRRCGCHKEGKPSISRVLQDTPVQHSELGSRDGVQQSRPSQAMSSPRQVSLQLPYRSSQTEVSCCNYIFSKRFNKAKRDAGKSKPRTK